MTGDDSRSRHTRHPDPYDGPAPSGEVPTARTMAVIAAAPVAAVVVASVPTATAAAVAGAVVGAALQRRFPQALAETLPTREPASDRERTGIRG